MTTPSPARAPRDWWARPRLMFPVLLAIFFVAALLTPEKQGASLDQRLSAHLAGAFGARGLADVATRLGWHTVLRDSTGVPSGRVAGTIHAVLNPVTPVTAVEAHRYLEAVRGGDALLLVLGERNPLSDSLGVRHAPHGGFYVPPVADTTGCGRRRDSFVPAIFTNGSVTLYALRWPRGRPADAETLASVNMATDDADEPAEDRRTTPKQARAASDTGAAESAVLQESVAGFGLGHGRVVVVADPDILRNDVLRHCAWGADVQAVRMLEWLSAGGVAPRSTIEFDEYHQGFGEGTSVLRVAARFLRGHPVGRTLLQLALASLLLLLAVAPRAIAPRERGRVERRDPLEQVGALGQAYRQVRATRTATLRLLGGVRARVERSSGIGRLRSDDELLGRAEHIDPSRAADVALVRRALLPNATGVALPEVGAALRRIEDTFTTTPVHSA